jgi:hypothetical protein
MFETKFDETDRGITGNTIGVLYWKNSRNTRVHI